MIERATRLSGHRGPWFAVGTRGTRVGWSAKARWLAPVLVLAGIVGCAQTKSTEANGQPLDAASSASGVSAPAVAPRAADPSTADEDVHPVYPLGGAPDPLAQRFCDALHDLPEKKRAACCAAPPRPSPDRECVRNVSAALRLGGVTLGASDVDACVKAMTASLDGCGWVGALGPSLPRACEGVLHGAFVTGQRCRSSLECAKGLHCAGVGPTDMGTCAEAGGDGAPCGRGVDALATFARDDSSDAEHPACAGLCKAGRCRTRIAEGAACVATSECVKGALCVADVCTHGKPGARGEPCPSLACESGLRCRGGVCADLGPEGAACTLPLDCHSGLCRDGKCAAACPR